MKSKLFRYTSLFIGILMIAGLFFGAMTSKAAANTQVQADSTELVSASQSPGWKAATRPWTKAEMLAAKPYPLADPGKERSVTTSPEAPDGAPGAIPSSLPMDAPAQPVVETGMDVFSSPSPLGYSYPGPFTRYGNFSSYTRYPYVTVGKLFFTRYGLNYVCSASSIGNYAIWTAGHCLHEGNADVPGGWSYNVVFIPAYKNGTAPKGQWLAENLWSISGWIYNHDPRYDMGGAILFTNASGLRISQVVGNLGFAWNQSVNLHWFQLGYPQAAPFNGLLMYINASSYAYSDANWGSPYPTGVGSDLTGGSSGGPWIYVFNGNAGPRNYLNGHNDYRYSGYPNEMFSPYFDTVAYNLRTSLVTDTP